MRPIGVCSWSLRPAGEDDLARRAAACGVDGVQLALDPIRRGEWDAGRALAALQSAGLSLLSGMMACRGEDYSTLDSIRRTGGIAPDAHWPENLQAARDNARIAADLGIPLVTMHAGFFPNDPRDPRHAVLAERLRSVSRAFRDLGVALALETGQETADTLLGVLRDLEPEGVGVNFDPANMILYGMGDPIAALETLAPWVRQVHIKDALPARAPGQWGTETPVGRGAVGWPALFRALDRLGTAAPAIIEREGGDARDDDIRSAAALVRRASAAQPQAAHDKEPAP